MKTHILLLLASILSITLSYAQPRAIGARVGSGIEFSYQHTVGKNFVSLDAGMIYGIMELASPTLIDKYGNGYYDNGSYRGEQMIGVEVVSTYNWLFPFNSWKHKGAWNWYVGAGLGVGYNNEYMYDMGKRYSADYGFAGLSARIGFEYNFWFPLQLSLDWRPIIGPCFSTLEDYSVVAFYTTGLYAGAVCLGIRYQF